MTLVERLRKAGYDPKINVYELLPEAADAIETLQAENERLTADFDLVADSCVAAQAKCDALAAKLATLEADAQLMEEQDTQAPKYNAAAIRKLKETL